MKHIDIGKHQKIPNIDSTTEPRVKKKYPVDNSAPCTGSTQQKRMYFVKRQ
jgi:hypothetical protein